MDDHARELIELLCTQAGMIMEDVSPIAILQSGSAAELAARIAQVMQAGEDILSLSQAAETTRRRASYR